MKHILLVIFNTLSFGAVIALNGMAGSGQLTGKSIGEISAKYDTLFTPAGYAFSIWGLIYLALIAFTVFQWTALLKKTNKEVIDQTGIWFIVTNLANIAWLFLWLNEALAWSVAAMLVLLAALIILMFRFKMETWDAPVRILALVWWPWAIYLGWIIVATVANIAALLTFLGWDGSPLTPQVWTVILIAVATVVYLFLILTRNLRESALVGVWALIAIAFRQHDKNLEIAVAASLAALVIFIAIAVHGWRNFKTNPLAKLQRGEF